jgi:ATP-binding cassette subfamily C protein CydC
MKSLVRIAINLWGRRRQALLTGILLSALVMLAGIALLGLSGWFVTASSVAGLAGAGLTFDVFRPSAGVRFLALGRAVARYGERLSTHDATLRVLADLRVDLLKAFLRRPVLELMRIRGSEKLQQFTADVDALDGLALRLLMPAVAALGVLALCFLLIGLLVNFVVAGSMLAIFLSLSVIAGWLVTTRTRRPSRLTHRSLWALRMRLIDTLRGRSELILARRLPANCAHVRDAGERLQQGQSSLDLVERKGAFLIAVGANLSAAMVLLLCGLAVVPGNLSPERAALAFFASLGLAELVLPLTRGLAEIGKMSDAARRLDRLLWQDKMAASDPNSVKRSGSEPTIVFDAVRISSGQRILVDHISFQVNAGETVALVGPSGGGKTTLLNIAAGLRRPDRGHVLLCGLAPQRIPEEERFACLGYLSQRSSLVSGTVRDNLLLAKPDAGSADVEQVLDIVRLTAPLALRGGPDTPLGEAGRGLSGGETRRLALARILLRRPSILLLDEPTEGLDRETAMAVLKGVQAFLPDAAILMASHRHEEVDVADRIYSIG